jgi:Sulfate permease family
MVGLARGLIPSSYRREWLAKDVVAGIVLSTLLVPQGMAYAELAGLPPIVGRSWSWRRWPGSGSSLT